MLVSKYVWLVIAVAALISFSISIQFANAFASGIYGGLGLASIVVFFLTVVEKEESKLQRMRSALREMHDLGFFTADEYDRKLRDLKFFFYKEKGGKENVNQ